MSIENLKKHLVGVAAPVLLAAAAAAPLDARSDNDMFLKLGDIKGESRDFKHKDEIDVLAWSWGVHNPAVPRAGGGTDPANATFYDIKLVKWVDKSTPDLLLSAATGKFLDQGELVVRSPGNSEKSGVEYVKFFLEGARVTSVAQGADEDDDRLTETITLNFAKVKIVYTPILDDGRPGTPTEFEWDVSKNISEF